MKNQSVTRFLGLTFLIFLIMLTACSQGGGEAQKAPGEEAEAKDLSVPVEVGVAARKPITASYSGTAALEPENQAQVVAKTSGVLLQILVEEGDQVRSGQLLARLDPEKPRLELARAEANLKRLENELKRSNDLVARKLVSAEANERARFDLETQKAAYDIARLELDYTQIIAPISGVISERMVKAGNLIQIQQALFRIDDFDPLLAVLNVPERELAILKTAMPVSMQVDALFDKSFSGTVARISPVVEANTGTFRVTTEFRDSTGLLKSGMFGRVSIIYDQRDDALVIPREALLEGDTETAVFLLDRAPPPEDTQAVDKKADPKAKPGFFARWFGGDKKASTADKKEVTPPAWYAKRVIVKLGYLSGSDAEVLSGLKPGEQVVTVGKNALREGVQLQVVGAERR